MNNVTKSLSLGHKHGVDIDLAEQWCGYRDRRWDVKSLYGTYLTLVAGSDVPFDVLFQMWPPKAFEQLQVDREYALVSLLIVGLHQ